MEPMEVVETFQKLDYKRERSTYKFIWNLACDDQGENLLFDYSDVRKKDLIPSGRMTCKTGFFCGPRKYFEFFASPSENGLFVHSKMVYPMGTVSVSSVKNSTDDDDEWNDDDDNSTLTRIEYTCIGEFDIISATFSPIMHNHERFEGEGFTFSPSFEVTPNTNDEKGSKVDWMTAYITETPGFLSKIKALGFLITLRHNILDENSAASAVADHNYDGNSSIFAAQINTKQFLFSWSASDIKIYCGNKEYPAHRIILANKSRVFHAMFSTRMEESITGKLRIEDTTPEVVEEFLRFIYTGSVENMEDNAPGICSMAEKYDVQDLKTISENYLIRSVSVQNVLERYKLGKILSSDALIKKSVQIMKAEKAVIWKTEGEFFEDCKKFPELFRTVFT